jgi:hypothetical protein
MKTKWPKVKLGEVLIERERKKPSMGRCEDLAGEDSFPRPDENDQPDRCRSRILFRLSSQPSSLPGAILLIALGQGGEDEKRENRSKAPVRRL